MATNHILKTHYRAIGDGGRTISESDDIEEVLAMSRGEMTDLLVQTERVVVSNWQTMPKNEVSRLRKIYYQ